MPNSDPFDNLGLELDKTESSLSSSVAEKDLYKSVAVLGYGSYGRVSLVQKTNGSDKGKYYAIKQIKKSHIGQKQQLIDNVVNELNVLVKVNHPMLSGMHYAYQN